MSHTNTNELKKIPLGSGNVYVMEYTGTLPATEAIEQEIHLIGRTKNGATISYSAEYYTAKSDDGIAQKTKVVGETATFEYGMITWNARTIKHLIATSRLTDDSGNKTRTLKIGGIDNDNGKSYVLRFVHKDKIDGDIRITIVGKATSGWEAAFLPSQESILRPTFTAEPQDNEGTLILYEEENLEGSPTPTNYFGGSPVYDPENDELATTIEDRPDNAESGTPIETFDGELDADADGERLTCLDCKYFEGDDISDAICAKTTDVISSNAEHEFPDACEAFESEESEESGITLTK